MPAITWFLTNNIADSVHQQLEEISPGSNATTSPTYGWLVGTTAPTVYSKADAGTLAASATFAASPIHPVSPLRTTSGQGDCWRTKQPYSGDFATGNWSFQMSAILVTGIGGSLDGNAGFRLWKGRAVDGSDAVEVTSGRLVGSTITNLTTTQQNSTHSSTSITGFHCDNEYLFIQIGWQISGAGLMTNDVVHRIGNTASQVTSTTFTDASMTKDSVANTEANSGAGTAWNTGGTQFSDNANSFVQTVNLDDESQNLDLTDFRVGGVPLSSFIAAGSQIMGFKFSIERSASFANAYSDLVIQMLKAGSPVGENKAVLATPWPTTDTTIDYGDEHDWWGTTWTQADAIHSGLGLRIRVVNTLGSGTLSALIDRVQLTVYFNGPIISSITGTATVAALAKLDVGLASTLTGSAALLANLDTIPAAGVDVPIAAGLSGSGTMLTTARLDLALTAGISGTGAIAPAPRTDLALKAAVAGSGAIAATARTDAALVAAISGTGAIATVARTDLALRAQVAGSGAIASIARNDAALVSQLTGSGALSAALRADWRVNAALLGSGFITAAPDTAATTIVPIAAILNGTGALAGNLRADRLLTSAIAGTGLISPALRADYRLASVIAGSGVMVAAPFMDMRVSAAVAGTATMIVTERVDRGVSSAIVGQATCSVILKADYRAFCVLTGTGALICDVIAFNPFVVAALSGTASVTALAALVAILRASVIGSATLDALLTSVPLLPPEPKERIPQWVLDEQRGMWISGYGKFPPW